MNTATVHTQGCNEAKCARTVGYCMGAADDTPALCDDCAAKLSHAEVP